MVKIRQFGLLGKEINYSFSRTYFAQKFKKEGLYNCRYNNFDLPDAAAVAKLLTTKKFAGLNVTIPYKEEVIPHLDALDPVAAKIGAVNTLCWKSGELRGYNTDAIGFEKALKEVWQGFHERALILGTGGASKAIAYVFEKNNIEYLWASRKASNPQQITYQEIDKGFIQKYTLIVNSTPLGTFPQVETCPELPYQSLGPEHCLFDLVYNPENTTFMQHGLRQKATVSNGYQMLVYQAEAAWEIWNS